MSGHGYVGVRSKRAEIRIEQWTRALEALSADTATRGWFRRLLSRR